MHVRECSISVCDDLSIRGRCFIPYRILLKNHSQVIIGSPCLLTLLDINTQKITTLVCSYWPKSFPVEDNSNSPKDVQIDPIVFVNSETEQDTLAMHTKQCQNISLIKNFKNASNVVLSHLRGRLQPDKLRLVLHGVFVCVNATIHIGNDVFKVVSLQPNSEQSTKMNMYKLQTNTQYQIEEDSVEEKREPIEKVMNNVAEQENDLLFTRISKQMLSLVRSATEILAHRARYYSILVQGPSNVGKTHDVRLCAKLLHIPLIYINCGTVTHPQSLVRKCLRAIVKQNEKLSEKISVILFLDDMDKCAGFNSSHVQQIIDFVCDEPKKLFLIIIGSTKINIDVCTRTKFQRNIFLTPPTREERFEFLTSYIGTISEVDMKSISERTIGYMCGDLNRLVKEILAKRKNEVISTSLIIACIKRLNIRPSLVRKDEVEDNSTSSINVDWWKQIGGLDEIKQKLKQAAEWPMKYPKSFERLGLDPPRGILLYGPPGCAKTTLVRALARSIHSTFLYCNVAQIYSPYLGEAERELRNVFQKARLLNPSIIFLDEIDAIVGRRDFTEGSKSNSGSVESRVLSTLLNEMDGIESTKNLLIIAATNRPDCIDAALLRPGRLDHILYVPPPDRDSKLRILEIFFKDIPVIDKEDIAENIANDENISGDMTGAELESLCREACMCAMREWERKGADYNENVKVELGHFIDARKRIQPIIRRDGNLIEKYRLFEKNFYRK